MDQVQSLHLVLGDDERSEASPCAARLGDVGVAGGP